MLSVPKVDRLILVSIKIKISLWFLCLWSTPKERSNPRSVATSFPASLVPFLGEEHRPWERGCLSWTQFALVIWIQSCLRDFPSHVHDKKRSAFLIFDLFMAVFPCIRSLIDHKLVWVINDKPALFFWEGTSITRRYSLLFAVSWRKVWDLWGVVKQLNFVVREDLMV